MTGNSNHAPGLVSIVICSYNNWPDVETTIESALQQSYRPIEVIVVDNSSTDITPEELPRRFGQKVCYIQQPNRDNPGAYNAGLERARGEFIQFVDGDDVLAPNKIEKQVEVFRAHPDLDIVYGDVRVFQTLAETARWEDVGTRHEDDMLAALILPERNGAGISALGTLFHRRSLEKVGSWDESMYSEDTDYWLRAAWAGCKFGHCPSPIMGFARKRPGQKGANADAMLLSMEAVWEKALGYVTNEPYRSQIAANLASQRFYLAISGKLMVREALRKLRQARATSPGTVKLLAYAAGGIAIVTPGGATLVRAPYLRFVRRALARLFQYPIPDTALAGNSSESAARDSARAARLS